MATLRAVAEDSTMTKFDCTKRSDCTVQAAKIGVFGLYQPIDGMWCPVESKPALLDKGLCILLDEPDTHPHFSSSYEAFWPGDPDDNSSPMMIAGGTDSPVVAMLMEQWAALPSLRTGRKLDVPSVEKARAALPALRAARQAE